MTIVTITGPTCSGKTSVESELQKLGLGRAISHTTRPMRAGEVNGQHYHFLTSEKFDAVNASGAFIEKVEFGTTKYALSSEALRQASIESKDVVIVVEPHGASQIWKFCDSENIHVFPVWIDCSPKEQAFRFIDRMTKDMAESGQSVSTYKERLSLMLGEEITWRANSRWWGYFVKFDSTHLTPKMLADKITELI